jgi:hypothetical protein
MEDPRGVEPRAAATCTADGWLHSSGKTLAIGCAHFGCRVAPSRRNATRGRRPETSRTLRFYRCASSSTTCVSSSSSRRHVGTRRKRPRWRDLHLGGDRLHGRADDREHCHLRANAECDSARAYWALPPIPRRPPRPSGSPERPPGISVGAPPAAGGSGASIQRQRSPMQWHRDPSGYSQSRRIPRSSSQSESGSGLLAGQLSSAPPCPRSGEPALPAPPLSPPAPALVPPPPAPVPPAPALPDEPPSCRRNGDGRGDF